MTRSVRAAYPARTGIVKNPINMPKENLFGRSPYHAGVIKPTRTLAVNPIPRPWTVCVSFQMKMKGRALGLADPEFDGGVAVIDLAAKLGIYKQTMYRAIRHLGILPAKIPKKYTHGRVALFITKAQARATLGYLRIRGLLTGRATRSRAVDTEMRLGEHGLFYIVLLEPTNDPKRFKLGFCTNIAARLTCIKANAPYARLLVTWPCKRLWERTATEFIAANCQSVNSEVFRTGSFKTLRERGDRFFSLMPKLPKQLVDYLTDEASEKVVEETNATELGNSSKEIYYDVHGEPHPGRPPRKRKSEWPETLLTRPTRKNRRHANHISHAEIPSRQRRPPRLH